MGSQRCSIVIVEDHRMVAEGFVKTLSEWHDVVGVAHDGPLALQLTLAKQPDVILLDIALGNESGLELIPLLTGRAPAAAIVLVTNFNEIGFQARARQLGALGFVSKTGSSRDLLDAISAVLDGNEWYSEPDPDQAYILSRLDSSVHLTQRQTQVLRQLANGASYKEIAKILNLTVNTVDVYLRRIRHILGGQKTIDLVRLAVQHGFLPQQGLGSSDFPASGLAPETKKPGGSLITHP